MRFVFLAAALLLSAPAYAQQVFGVSSPNMADGQPLPRSAIYNGAGCEGDNISPALEWFNPPEGTQSYAVSMYDPDSIREGGYLHWVIFNIPRDVRMLVADAGRDDRSKLPEGANSISGSSGDRGYTGPCPPVGSIDKPHRYEFTVYAMPEAQMFYPLSAIGKPTITWMNEKALGSATLTPVYGR